MPFTRLVISCLIPVLFVSVSSAQVPGEISYQGRLTDASGDPVADGNYTIQFSMWDAPSGEAHLEWTSGFQTVTTTGGLFSYQLGSNVALPTGLWKEKSELWLEIEIQGDPPMSPRTKLAAVPYAQHAGTVGPNVVLGNGTTKGTLSLEDAGLNETRITLDADMAGNGGAIEVFDELGNPIITARPDDDGAGGWFEVRSIGDTLGFYVDGNYLGSGRARAVVRDQGGSNDVVLDASAAEPDLVVRLPTGSVNAFEISDEPGLASALDASSVELSTVVQDIQTVTIDIPNDGYIFLTGRCYFSSNGPNSFNSVRMQIDETPGGSMVIPYYSVKDLTSLKFTMYASRIYMKSAGSYTFRLEAEKGEATETISASWPMLTAMYFPTSYDAVAAVTSDPTGFDNAQLVPGIKSTNGEPLYKVDLRELEIRAKEAKIKALEAAEALREAKAKLRLTNTMSE